MKYLLRLWQPKNKFCKFIKRITNAIAICVFLAFLILPFIQFDYAKINVTMWIWLGCAGCNIDSLWDYKKYHEQKLLTPLFTIFSILTLVYIHNYWDLLSVASVVCISIVIGLLEFIISSAAYKTIRFSEKTEVKELPQNVIQGIVLGGLYACAIILFVLAHYTTENMIFIFGGISAIMLSVSVLICIGNGISFKKSVFKTISFIVDVLSLLALIIYLIYLIPNDKNLQNIVLAIIAAVVGGVLALAGVAWTIKDGNKQRQEELHRVEYERKEEERKKIIPFVALDTDNKEPNHTITINGICYSDKNNKRFSYNIANFNIVNTELSIFSIGGLYFNNRVSLCRSFSLINKNWIVKFDIEDVVSLSEELSDFGIYAQDLIGNEYKIPLDFDIIKGESITDIKVKGCYRSQFLPEGQGIKKEEDENE